MIGDRLALDRQTHVKLGQATALEACWLTATTYMELARSGLSEST